MEVHHPHVSAGKRWTHHLWEFLMLFLAVFAGFLAENWRERVLERHREVEYIRSLRADLEEDIVDINAIRDGNITKLYGLDTMISLLKGNQFPDTLQYRLTKLNGRYASNVYILSIHERTLQQLLSSGNMRLIREQQISDSIMQYYNDSRNDLVNQSTIYQETMKRALFFGEDIFDNTRRKAVLKADSTIRMQYTNDPARLFTVDKVVLRRFANMLATSSAMIANYIQMLTIGRRQATNLISFLNKKYKLD